MSAVPRQPTARIAFLGLAASVALAGWGLWRERVRGPAVGEAAALLSALPRSAASSQTDKVIADLTGRLERNPFSEDAWTSLGDALMQKARESMDVRYYGHAQAAFQKALALDAGNIQAVVGLSWVYGSRHEFQQSIEWARKALALEADEPAAYGLLGDAAVELGDYEAAFQHYQRMLDISPDLSSYSRSAHLLFLTGDTQRAMLLVQKAIAAGGPHAENTAWCRAQLALMQLKTGALLAAEQTLDVGLDVAPNNYHLLAAMGRVKAAKKEYDAAIGYYERAAAIAPQADVVVALGDLYVLTARHKEADRQFALLEAIHRTQKASGVRGDIVMARFYADHDRRPAEALKIAEQEYAAFPNVYAAETLAWAHYKNGRYEDARKMIEKALSRKTPEAGFHFRAGMIYAALGHRPAAQRHLYHALSLNPGFHPVQAQVAADTLARLGSSGSDSPQPGNAGTR